jgi:hypothetical protein
MAERVRIEHTFRLNAESTVLKTAEATRHSSLSDKIRPRPRIQKLKIRGRSRSLQLSNLLYDSIRIRKFSRGFLGVNQLSIDDDFEDAAS